MLCGIRVGASGTSPLQQPTKFCLSTIPLDLSRDGRRDSRAGGAIPRSTIHPSTASHRGVAASGDPRHQSVFKLHSNYHALTYLTASVLLARRKSAQRGDAVILAGCSDAGKTAILSTVSCTSCPGIRVVMSSPSSSINKLYRPMPPCKRMLH